MKPIYPLLALGITFLFVGGACPKPDAMITSIEPENSNTANSKFQTNDNRQITNTEEVSEYVEYSPEALIEAQANGIAVLYFYAPWCPTCTLLNQDLLDNTTDLPPGVTILKVDYDTAEDLKDQYDVIQQHTLIQLDANGNEVTRWIGGDVETIVDSIIYP